MHKFYQILIIGIFTLIALISFKNSSAQSTISLVSIPLVYPNNQAASQIEVTITDSNGLSYYTVTDSNGEAYFYSVQPANYTLRVQPSNFSNFNRYKQTVANLNLTQSSSFYNSSTDSIQLSPVSLTEYSNQIALIIGKGESAGLVSSSQNVTEILTGATIFGYQSDNYQARQISGSSDSSGVINIGYDTSQNTKYWLYISKSGYSSVSLEIDLSKLGSINYLSLPANLSVANINLTTPSGQPRVTQSGEYGSVYCNLNNQVGSSQNVFVSNSQTLSSAESSVSLPLTSGYHNCTLSLTDKPSQTFTVNIQSNETKSYNIVIRELDSKIILNLQNQYEEVYRTTVTTYLNCSSVDNNYNFFLNNQIGISKIEIDVVSGTYNCSLYGDGISISANNLEVESSTTKNHDLIFEVPNSSIELILRDSLTNSNLSVPPSAYATASCSDYLNQRYYSKQIAANSSSVVLDVVAGSYSCSVSLSGYTSDYITALAEASESNSYFLKLDQLTHQVTFNFVDSNNQPLNLSDTNQTYFSCFDSSNINRNSFGSSVISGSNSVTIKMVRGNFTCNLNGSSFESSRLNVTLTSAQTNPEFNIPVLVKDIPVTVKLVDLNSNIVSVPSNGSATLFCTEDDGRYLNFEFASGLSQATVTAAPGKYRCNLSGNGISANTQLQINVIRNSSQIYDLVTILGTVKLRINFIDGDTGQPIVTPTNSYSYLSCYNYSQGISFSNSVTGGESFSEFYLAAGDYDCNFNLASYQSKNFKVNLSNSASAFYDLTLYPPNSTININLVNNTNGSSFSLTRGSFGSINCTELNNNNNSTNYFYALNGGDSTGTLPVRAGVYNCLAWIPGYGTSKIEVQAPINSLVTGAIKVYAEDSIITAKVIDKTTGQPITNETFSLSANSINRLGESTTLEHHAFNQVSNGQATLSVVNDLNYEVSIHKSFDSTVNGSSYILPGSMITVTASTINPQNLIFEAQKANSFIEITLSYPDGRLVERGWIYASSFNGLNSKNRGLTDGNHFESVQIVNGKGTLGLLAGKEYQVSAYADSLGSFEWIPPEIINVTLKENETKSFNLKLLKPDFNLKVKVSVKDESNLGAAAFTNCYSLDSLSRQTYSFSDNSKDLNLQLLTEGKTTPITVSCSVHYPGQNSEPGKIFVGETNYVPAQSTNSGEVEILVSSFGNFYNFQSYSFDAALGAIFTLQDDATKITIPPKAVANSGNATMLVGSATGYSFLDNNFPLLTFDIKFKVDDKIISDMSQPVTISFPVDSDQIKKLGGDLTQLKAGSFEESTRIWRLDATYSYNEELKVLSVSVSHFSVWGMLVDLAKKISLKITPTNLRAKFKKRIINKKTNTKLFQHQICWNEPETVADNSVKPTYELQLLIDRKNKTIQKRMLERLSKSSKINWNKAKSFKTKKLCRLVQVGKGNHMVRVRLISSVYTEPVKFKGGKR